MATSRGSLGDVLYVAHANLIQMYVCQTILGCGTANQAYLSSRDFYTKYLKILVGQEVGRQRPMTSRLHRVNVMEEDAWHEPYVWHKYGTRRAPVAGGLLQVLDDIQAFCRTYLIPHG